MRLALMVGHGIALQRHQAVCGCAFPEWPVGAGSLGRDSFESYILGHRRVVQGNVTRRFVGGLGGLRERLGGPGRYDRRASAEQDCRARIGMNIFWIGVLSRLDFI